MKDTEPILRLGQGRADDESDAIANAVFLAKTFAVLLLAIVAFALVEFLRT